MIAPIVINTILVALFVAMIVIDRRNVAKARNRRNEERRLAHEQLLIEFETVRSNMDLDGLLMLISHINQQGDINQQLNRIDQKTKIDWGKEGF